MPGTIQVSVLDFVSLQSSSPPSQTSIKVSMGKIEYETWEKGDFSFPLTTLRDNLIITLKDAQGNEISHTGVETRLVIEKGIWDDTFPLEGGGHVHMKLQFSLSEEDRQRIHIMRESALRKKRNQLLSNEAIAPHYAPTSGSDVTSPLQHKNEVSAAATQVVQISDPPAVLEDKKSGHEDSEGNHSVEKQASPNDTDGSEDNSSTFDVSQRLKAHLKEVSTRSSGDKCESGTSLADDPLRTIRWKEDPLVGSSGSKAAVNDKIPVKLKEVGVGDQEKRNPLEKDQRNVRNMISAFEDSLNQDKKRKTRPPATIKPQTNRSAAEVFLASSHLREIKMGKNKPAPLSGRIENLFHTRNVQESPELTGENEEKISYVEKLSQVTTQDMGELNGLRPAHFETKGAKADLKDKFKVISEAGKMQEKEAFEDLLRSSRGERPSISGRVVNEQLGSHPQSNSLDRNQNSAGNAMTDNGSWIFPDEGKRLCITTAGKQIMNMMGGFWVETEIQPRKMSSSAAESMKEATVHGSTSSTKAKEDEKSSQRFRNSKADGPKEAETSRGPMGQIVRVAIMVGFATLVLFTRQKKPD